MPHRITRRWHVTISCQPDGRPPQPVRPWKSGRVHLAEGSNVVVLELPYSTPIALNPLDSKGNYSDISNYTKLVHWPLMGGLSHLVQRGEAWAGCAAPPSLLLAVPNVTARPSTASVPITVLLYDGPLLCGFNVAIKGLRVSVSLELKRKHFYVD